MTLYKFILLALSLIATSSIAFADVYVHGYERKDGTHVDSHYRSSPDSTTSDNWSHYGNTNPHTGAIGKDKKAE